MLFVGGRPGYSEQILRVLLPSISPGLRRIRGRPTHTWTLFLTLRSNI
jgi:hypothetical protein